MNSQVNELCFPSIRLNDDFEWNVVLKNVERDSSRNETQELRSNSYQYLPMKSSLPCARSYLSREKKRKRRSQSFRIRKISRRNREQRRNYFSIYTGIFCTDIVISQR